MNKQENRSAPRKRVNEKIELRDVHTDQLVGNLVNISVSGFMLLADRSLSENQLFQLRMLLPSPIEDVEYIELGAECLWRQDAPDTDHCWAGFHIIDISEQGTRLIQRLLSDWTE